MLVTNLKCEMPKSHRAKSHHTTKQEFYDKDELNDFKIDKWQDPTPVTIQENNNDHDHDPSYYGDQTSILPPSEALLDEKNAFSSLSSTM